MIKVSQYSLHKNKNKTTITNKQKIDPMSAWWNSNRSYVKHPQYLLDRPKVCRKLLRNCWLTLMAAQFFLSVWPTQAAKPTENVWCVGAVVQQQRKTFLSQMSHIRNTVNKKLVGGFTVLLLIMDKYCSFWTELWTKHGTFFFFPVWKRDDWWHWVVMVSQQALSHYSSLLWWKAEFHLSPPTSMFLCSCLSLLSSPSSLDKPFLPYITIAFLGVFTRVLPCVGSGAVGVWYSVTVLR